MNFTSSSDGVENPPVVKAPATASTTFEKACDDVAAGGAISPADAYLAFLRAKIPQAEAKGFEPPSHPHYSLFPHQIDICTWAIRGGRRAIFANFGLGKTRMHLQLAKWVCEKTAGKFLIIAPLGVKQEFTQSDGDRKSVV